MSTGSSCGWTATSSVRLDYHHEWREHVWSWLGQLHRRGEPHLNAAHRHPDRGGPDRHHHSVHWQLHVQRVADQRVGALDGPEQQYLGDDGRTLRVDGRQAQCPGSQLPGGASMTGLGSTNYTVAPNGTGSARTGTLTVAGQTVTITQSTGSCSYSVSPTSASALSTGQSSSISVTTGGLCAWTATSAVPWMTITGGASMTGLGSTNYTVAPNATGSARTGTLTVAGQIVTITQSTGSCTYSVSPTSASALSTGQSSSISVTTGGLCAWTATSAVPWITITGGASMTGLGSANYTVAPNATGSARTGNAHCGRADCHHYSVHRQLHLQRVADEHGRAVDGISDRASRSSQVRAARGRRQARSRGSVVNSGASMSGSWLGQLHRCGDHKPTHRHIDGRGSDNQHHAERGSASGVAREPPDHQHRLLTSRHGSAEVLAPWAKAD